MDNRHLSTMTYIMIGTVKPNNVSVSECVRIGNKIVEIDPHTSVVAKWKLLCNCLKGLTKEDEIKR